jgi:hypothetical protein
MKTRSQILIEVKKDFKLLLDTNDLEGALQYVAHKKLKALKKLVGQFTGFIYHDTGGIVKDINMLGDQHCTDKFYEMFIEMYKLGYKMYSINSGGLREGKLMFRAKDERGNSYVGFADMTGFLNLSIVSMLRQTYPIYKRVLVVMYKKEGCFVKHTLIQALFQSAGFSLEGN